MFYYCNALEAFISQYLEYDNLPVGGLLSGGGQGIDE